MLLLLLSLGCLGQAWVYVCNKWSKVENIFLALLGVEKYLHICVKTPDSTQPHTAGILVSPCCCIQHWVEVSGIVFWCPAPCLTVSFFNFQMTVVSDSGLSPWREQKLSLGKREMHFSDGQSLLTNYLWEVGPS